LLDVRLLAIYNVPKMDWWGRGQAYAKLWLRPRALRRTPTKPATHNLHFTREEASFAMPIHVKFHQLLTVALWDEDVLGDDEFGRGHFPLKELADRQPTDVRVSLGAPQKHGSREKGQESTKDKLVAAAFGAKGAAPEDLEGTTAHLQVTFHPLSKESVEAVQKAQLNHDPVGPRLIKETALRDLIVKYNLFDEMFEPPKKEAKVTTDPGKGPQVDKTVALS
jgi:hypothetical protein